MSDKIAFFIRSWCSNRPELSNVAVESVYKFTKYSAAAEANEQEVPSITVISTISIDEIFEEEVLK
jgi:hypothetical protein